MVPRPHARRIRCARGLGHVWLGCSARACTTLAVSSRSKRLLLLQLSEGRSFPVLAFKTLLKIPNLCVNLWGLRPICSGVEDQLDEVVETRTVQHVEPLAQLFTVSGFSALHGCIQFSRNAEIDGSSEAFPHVVHGTRLRAGRVGCVHACERQHGMMS